MWRCELFCITYLYEYVYASISRQLFGWRWKSALAKVRRTLNKTFVLTVDGLARLSDRWKKMLFPVHTAGAHCTSRDGNGSTHARSRQTRSPTCTRSSDVELMNEIRRWGLQQCMHSAHEVHTKIRRSHIVVIGIHIQITLRLHSTI